MEFLCAIVEGRSPHPRDLSCPQTSVALAAERDSAPAQLLLLPDRRVATAVGETSYDSYFLQGRLTKVKGVRGRWR